MNKTAFYPDIRLESVSLSSCIMREHRLHVFQNSTHKGIVRYVREIVTETWRKIQNDELRDVHSSPNSIETA
jgi:hypothetical protein